MGGSSSLVVSGGDLLGVDWTDDGQGVVVVEVELVLLGTDDSTDAAVEEGVGWALFGINCIVGEDDEFKIFTVCEVVVTGAVVSMSIGGEDDC